MDLDSSVRVVKRYRVDSYGDVFVEIVESVDGMLRYVVREPPLEGIANKILSKAIEKIMSDTKLLTSFTQSLDIEEATRIAKQVVERVAKRVAGFRKRVDSSVIDSVVYYVVRDFVGYGPLDPLMRDPFIEDITCDGVAIPVHVFHSEFEWLETNIVFPDSESLERVVRKLAYRCGKEPTVAQPIVEGTLRPEGYRVHIVLDVVSRRGHTFTIRKFRATPFTVAELIARRTLDPGVAAILWMAAENKQGIVIFGPTGSGKTTLLNAVAMLLPSEMKIVTAEDTPEIVLPFHDNWVALVTRLAQDSYVQSVTLQAQVESAMRQRPDVLILGEIRSREAYSYFQAVSTGHGGITTIHAESIESLIRRLVSPPMNVPKSLVATNRLYVHILRMVIGGNVVRKVMAVYEVVDYDPMRDVMTIRTLARWDRERDRWLFAPENSSLFKAIAELLAVSYRDVLEDFRRRAYVLLWAAKRGLDVVSLHALVRRYRRDPEGVYREVVKEIGSEYEIEVMDREEIKTL